MASALTASNTTTHATYHQIQASKDINKRIPASHDECINLVVKIAIVVAAVLALSIVFWAVGASTHIAGLVVTGKAFFGLTVGTLGLLALGGLGLFIFKT